jgi:hypothetical protein
MENRRLLSPYRGIQESTISNLYLNKGLCSQVMLVEEIISLLKFDAQDGHNSSL